MLPWVALQCALLVFNSLIFISDWVHLLPLCIGYCLAQAIDTLFGTEYTRYPVYHEQDLQV